jgi:hypothetical protein
LRGEDRLRVFQNGMPRKKFGPEMKEVTWKLEKTA